MQAASLAGHGNHYSTANRAPAIILSTFIVVGAAATIAGAFMHDSKAIIAGSATLGVSVGLSFIRLFRRCINQTPQSNNPEDYTSVSTRSSISVPVEPAV
jgi:hypothetical protein